MPFYNAWQELLLAGLGYCKSCVRARGLRYFRAIKGEDDNGDSRFVIRMPEGLLDPAGQSVWELSLGFTSLKLHPDSISMLSAGLPGFGPVVTIAASESVIAQPSLEAMEWLLHMGHLKAQMFPSHVATS